MDILEIIKTLVPGLSDEQYNQLGAILDLAGYTNQEGTGEGDTAAAADGAEPIRSIDVARLAIDLKSLGYNVVLPGQGKPKAAVASRLPFSSEPGKPVEGAMKSMEAAYLLKFGEEDSAKKAILGDVIGPDYRQRIYDQNVAFGKYIRHGERDMEREEIRSLKSMIFPLEQIYDLAKEGMDIPSIKATQVEAQGELGGYTVPPNVQSEITARLPARTAVRGGGARIVQLVNSNSIEIPLYKGTGMKNKYIGLIRGQWGNESAAPGTQNLKVDMETIVAHVYTYKVPMSQSLVEDAANLVGMLQTDIQDTMVIDEDAAFLTGDGVGKPRGIIPGGSNLDALTEVKVGSTTAYSALAVKSLKRGVASQYRDQNCIWVGQSDTFGAIEVLTVGGGNLTYAFPDLSETEELLSRRVFESESMPVIASAAYPLMFGNMRGYTIVERLGMTIQRFQDSNTGPNVVEYHVRRRLGGRTERPWMFALSLMSV